jgi:hypothetical protein
MKHFCSSLVGFGELISPCPTVLRVSTLHPNRFPVNPQLQHLLEAAPGSGTALSTLHHTCVLLLETLVSAALATAERLTTLTEHLHDNPPLCNFLAA